MAQDSVCDYSLPFFTANTYITAPSIGNLNNVTFTLPNITSVGSTYITCGAGGSGGYSMSGTVSITPPTIFDDALTVRGSVHAEDVVIDGVSMKDVLTKIEERLAILTPDPKKLAKYEALKQAYEHYKTLERLCTNTDSE